MKVTVFGTGYVGLVQGAVLADVGHQVLCVDVDEKKVAALKAGQIPIHEPGLDALVINNQQLGRLQFTTNAQEGVAHSELIFWPWAHRLMKMAALTCNMCWPWPAPLPSI